MAHERICCVCGTAYQYCSHCDQYKNLEPWHNIYHDDKCRSLFKICSRYVAKAITPEEAKEQIEELQFGDLSKVVPGIKANVDEIFVTAKKKDILVPEIEFTDSDRAETASIQGNEEQALEEKHKPLRRSTKKQLVNEL